MDIRDVIAYTGANGLALPAELVSAVRTLDMAKLRPSTRESFDLLLSALQGTADGTELKKALGAAAWTAVQKEWETLKARAIDKLPDKLKPLASPINTLGTALDVPLLTTSATAPVGPYFNVKGDLAFGLEVQSTTAFDPALAGGEVLLPDEVALRFGLDGQIGAGVSGGVTYGWGTVRAGAEATGQVDLDVLYARPGSEILAASIVNAVEGGLHFSDLTALPAARARGLRRLHLHANGKLSVSAAVSAGASVLYEIAPTGVTPKPITVTGTVGGKLSVAASLEGSYDVSVDVGEGGGVTITIDRSTKTGRSLGLEVGVDIVIEGLAEQAGGVVNAVLPDASPLLDVIGKYADPVALLEDRLKKEVSTLLQGGPLKDEADSLALLLTGETSAANVASGIADRITGRLTAALDDRIAAAVAGGDSAIAQLATEAAGRLPEWLGTSLSGKIQQPLQKAFEGALKSISSELEQAVTANVTAKVKAADGQLEQILKPLQLVGTDVAKLQTDVKAKVDAVIAPIKNFILEYQKVRTRITAALEKTATEKLSLTFAASITRTDETRSLFTCRITEATDSLRTFYRSLWMGHVDLSAVMPVDGKLPPGVAAADGTLVRTLHDERDVSVALNFFGWSASNTVTRLSEVTIAEDSSGRLTLLKSSAEVADATKAFDYVKQARMDFGFDLKVDAAGKKTLTAPTLVAAYTVAEEDVKFGQLMDYLQSLQDAGLLSSDGSGRAKEAIARGDARQDRHLKDMSMQLRLPTDVAGWQHWLALDKSSVFDIFSEGYFEAARRFKLPGWEFSTAMGMFAGATNLDALAAFRTLAVIGNAFSIDSAVETKLQNSLSNFSQDVRAGFRIIRSCALAVSQVMAARDTWRSYVTLALNAGELTDPGIVKQLDDLNRRLTGQLRLVISSSMTFIGNERAVPVLTSGFILGMLQATGRGGQLVPLVLSYTENGPHELILV